MLILQFLSFLWATCLKLIKAQIVMNKSILKTLSIFVWKFTIFFVQMIFSNLSDLVYKLKKELKQNLKCSISTEATLQLQVEVKLGKAIPSPEKALIRLGMEIQSLIRPNT